MVMNWLMMPWCQMRVRANAPIGWPLWPSRAGLQPGCPAGWANRSDHESARWAGPGTRNGTAITRHFSTNLPGGPTLCSV
jgi:hypothetical protein